MRMKSLSLKDGGAVSKSDIPKLSLRSAESLSYAHAVAEDPRDSKHVL